MNNLTIINQNNQLLVRSTEVAELVGKEHSHLMRDIRGYVEVLKKSHNPKLDSENFFIESTYINTRNQTQPCYLLTRKGCDMVANKMTGEKGIIFTATYVSRFEEMEKQLKNNLPTTYKEALLQLVQQVEENEKLQLENQELEIYIEETKPKVKYADEILLSDGAVLVTNIAADYGMSARTLNKILEEERIQRKSRGQWILYKNYMGHGYTKSETEMHGGKARSQTLWTQKGRMLIHEVLSRRGIRALVDLDNSQWA